MDNQTALVIFRHSDGPKGYSRSKSSIILASVILICADDVATRWTAFSFYEFALHLSNYLPILFLEELYVLTIPKY